jgi:hypothetical protein
MNNIVNKIVEMIEMLTRRFNPREMLLFFLTMTVCITILGIVARFIYYPPGEVLDATRDKMFDVMFLVLGLISGYVLRDVPHRVIEKDEPHNKEEEKKP